MSCAKGTYSSEKDTWSQQSNLTMGNYDPYPELQPKNAWWMEHYQDKSACSDGYSSGGVQQGMPLTQSNMMLREGYNGCYKSQKYSDVNRTWGQQDRFGL